MGNTRLCRLGALYKEGDRLLLGDFGFFTLAREETVLQYSRKRGKKGCFNALESTVELPPFLTPQQVSALICYTSPRQ